MNGTALAVAPDPGCDSLLPGHDFVDAYQVRADVPGLEARQAADAILKHPPGWIKQLMAARNRVVRLFQLKTVEMAMDDPRSPQGKVGGFPIVAQSPREVVLGFNDKHLDFRISVTVLAAGGAATLVTVCTLVKTNNLLGRAYLTTILPFHRIIVRHLLEHASFS
ncbi:hypothetical protein LT85_1850 [Collimonas arenae]|uniref:DUF2867 domain-containing protein n=1 Tax=Collimonas arenae TaxID=279058 RepID=A0A0A1F8E5_9BURK|nr:DUF2867 domain-containing protein [Collimonas arenae]AIY41008.1 hypothetical protein LT85_1850 [Collimonas arenae]